MTVVFLPSTRFIHCPPVFSSLSGSGRPGTDEIRHQLFQIQPCHGLPVPPFIILPRTTMPYSTGDGPRQDIAPPPHRHVYRGPAGGKLQRLHVIPYQPAAGIRMSPPCYFNHQRRVRKPASGRCTAGTVPENHLKFDGPAVSRISRL